MEKKTQPSIHEKPHFGLQGGEKRIYLLKKGKSIQCNLIYDINPDDHFIYIIQVPYNIPISQYAIVF